MGMGPSQDCERHFVQTNTPPSILMQRLWCPYLFIGVSTTQNRQASRRRKESASPSSPVGVAKFQTDPLPILTSLDIEVLGNGRWRHGSGLGYE
jgi:hypothetical protein